MVSRRALGFREALWFRGGRFGFGRRLGLGRRLGFEEALGFREGGGEILGRFFAFGQDFLLQKQFFGIFLLAHTVIPGRGTSAYD